MGLFSFLSGGGKVKEALKKGAVVIDVRSAAEFDRGRVPGSINIPVDRISINIGRIREINKTIVLCCESGFRSGKAMNLLRSAGINDVFNGGSWESVLKKVQSL